MAFFRFVDGDPLAPIEVVTGDVLAVFEFEAPGIPALESVTVAVLMVHQRVYADFPNHPIADACQYLHLTEHDVAIALPNDHFVDNAKVSLDFAHAQGWRDPTRGVRTTKVGRTAPVASARQADTPRWLLLPPK